MKRLYVYADFEWLYTPLLVGELDTVPLSVCANTYSMEQYLRLRMEITSIMWRIKNINGTVSLYKTVFYDGVIIV